MHTLRTTLHYLLLGIFCSTEAFKVYIYIYIKKSKFWIFDFFRWSPPPFGLFSPFGTFLISIGPLTLFSRLALTVEENYCCWLPFTAGRGLQMREDILKCRKRSSKYNKRSSNAGWDCQMQEEILKCMKRSSYIGRDLQTQEEIFKWILIIDLIFVHRSGTNKWLCAHIRTTPHAYKNHLPFI